MAVETTFDYKPREHYRALRAVTRLTSSRYWSFAFLLFAVAMLGWTVLPNLDVATPSELLWSALPWVLLGAFWVGITPFLLWRAAKKLPERDPSAIGPQLRVVDENGYHSLGNGVSVDIPWHAMLKAAETPEFVLFFYNKQCAYYIPKHSLAADKLAELRRLTRANLGARAAVLTDEQAAPAAV
jgi:hypothetical protein